jgi:hypothetical protein
VDDQDFHLASIDACNVIWSHDDDENGMIIPFQHSHVADQSSDDE